MDHGSYSFICEEQHLYPERCVVEDHTIKRHAVGSLLNTSELQKSIVLALQLTTFEATKERKNISPDHV